VRPALLLSLFFLGVLIAVELLVWDPVPPSRHTPANIDPAHTERLSSLMIDEPLPEFRLPGLRVYREITERPLFTKERRMASPPQPQTQLPTDPGIVLYYLELQAVVITPQAREAVVYDKKSRQVLRIQKNSEIYNWRVAEIDHNELVLSHGQETITIPLRSAR
jgi:hypothetical protein